MHVVATAGHVDHGKSTLVRALTGMEPDRWAEERRRGMTIDLGFAWAPLPSGETVVFVDVPGHERFVPNMLAGVGPVPAAMVVVAADAGWMPQSAEHLAALAALDVRHGLLVVTRSDLADPCAATAAARAELAGTPLADVEAVAVSGVTGAGLDELRAALGRLAGRLPPPETDGPVRLWVDRVFTIRGAGTVVTGTLGGGRIRVGDELALSGGRIRAADQPGGATVRVRGLQMLGAAAEEAVAVARVAVNLRGTPKERIGRGGALLTPGRFRLTGLIDVRIHADPVAMGGVSEVRGGGQGKGAELTLHVGSAAVAARVRPLGADTWRLRLARALPLTVGDRALLRDPGRHHVVGGVTVLDVAPPGLSRRGAAAARAAQLAELTGSPDVHSELRRRLLVHRRDLAAMGVPADGEPVAGEWFADPAHWRHLGERLAEEVARHHAEHPLEPGAPVEALRHRLGLPDRALVEALVHPPFTMSAGRVSAETDLPTALINTVNRVLPGERRFVAPEADELKHAGLGPRQLGAAVRAGLLVQLAPQVVLRADAPDGAAAVLATLPQPFTLSEARRALGTTRRVAVPLLELLDRRGLTRRLPDDRRTTRAVSTD